MTNEENEYLIDQLIELLAVEDSKHLKPIQETIETENNENNNINNNNINNNNINNNININENENLYVINEEDERLSFNEQIHN